MQFGQLKRRQFILLLGGFAAWPLAARAQQADRMRRIGLLLGIAEDAPETKVRLAGFRQSLESLGWSEGANVRLDFRYAPAVSEDEAKVLARELVILRPDVLVAQTVLARALKNETRTIPIVFLSVGDPIGLGLIASLARPDGNLTGVMTFESSVAGKWLVMLKEINPQLARAAFMGNPKTTTYDYYRRAADGAASSLGIESVPGIVATASDVERVIDSIAREPGTGLVVLPDPTNIFHQDQIIALAAHYKIPAVYDRREYVAAGGLMSYGVDRVDEFRRAAAYVDRILRGAKPTDLPVQEPTKFETVLNLKTAKALSLAVPAGLLVAADEVIE
jgi:putative tryptophan/tyrosine transport system substrate-binding protein